MKSINSDYLKTIVLLLFIYFAQSTFAAEKCALSSQLTDSSKKVHCLDKFEFSKRKYSNLRMPLTSATRSSNCWSLAIPNEASCKNIIGFSAQDPLWCMDPGVRRKNNQSALSMCEEKGCKCSLVIDANDIVDEKLFFSYAMGETDLVELDPVLPKQNTTAQTNSTNKPTDLPTPTKRAPPIALQVTASEPDISGAVYISVQSNVSTVSLKINDEEQGGDTAGKYSIKKFAMVGKPTTFTIVATDSNGNTDTKTVSVTRKAVDSAPVFTQLNPNNIKEHSKRDAVAIIIGIQDYKRLARAEYANTDAQVFYDYAVRALGIPAANIKLLVDADADQVDVYKALRNWLPAKVNKGKTDVYVFYSGHGLPAEDGKSLYLLPYGADKDFLDKTAISQQEINNMLKAAQAKSITLFLDSCYSGQSRTGETLLASARPIALKAQSSAFPPEFAVITATAPEQMSWSSPELKHGIFSYYLMKGMEGDADLNKDGVINMQEMQNYLTENVARQAQRNGRTQLPQL